MAAANARCEAITLKGRRCQKTFSFVCNKTMCCYIHAYPYSSYALTIQKAYKGYHSRKYVRLLTKLPCDIQKNIVFYIKKKIIRSTRILKCKEIKKK